LGAGSRYTFRVVWELIFLMLIMKIPVVYLCLVVWWAIRAEPRPEENASVTVSIAPQSGPGWIRGRSPRRHDGPHGGPARTYARTTRTAHARAAARRR
jgi:hypothetical protein